MADRILQEAANGGLAFDEANGNYDGKIDLTNLAAAGALDKADLALLSQSGANKKASLEDIRDALDLSPTREFLQAGFQAEQTLGTVNPIYPFVGDVVLSAAGGFVTARNGSITALTVIYTVTGEGTTGSLDFAILIDGTPVWEMELDGNPENDTNVIYNATQNAGLDEYTEEQVISLRFDELANGSLKLSNVICIVEIQTDAGE